MTSIYWTERPVLITLEEWRSLHSNCLSSSHWAWICLQNGWMASSKTKPASFASTTTLLALHLNSLLALVPTRTPELSLSSLRMMLVDLTWSGRPMVSGSGSNQSQILTSSMSETSFRCLLTRFRSIIISMTLNIYISLLHPFLSYNMRMAFTLKIEVYIGYNSDTIPCLKLLRSLSIAATWRIISIQY